MCIIYFALPQIIVLLNALIRLNFFACRFCANSGRERERVTWIGAHEMEWLSDWFAIRRDSFVVVWLFEFGCGCVSSVVILHSWRSQPTLLVCVCVFRLKFDLIVMCIWFCIEDDLWDLWMSLGVFFSSRSVLWQAIAAVTGTRRVYCVCVCMFSFLIKVFDARSTLV